MKEAGEARPGHSAIGDDVASLPARGRRISMKVDMLVEGTDVPRGMTYRQAARKAVAMCVSDFAAKGVRPDSFMVSLGLRRGTSVKQVKDLGKGLRDAEVEWGVHLAGGDTNETSELVIDCAMIGFGAREVGRSGARPGDLLVVSGAFGLPPAGLRILLGGMKATQSFRKRAVSSVMAPNPHLGVGLALGKFLSSGMDSSDGLARCLHTLSASSGVGFDVSRLPAAPGVSEFAAANKIPSDELILSGGEEYVIVGTMAKRHYQSALTATRRSGGELTMIGKVTGRKGSIVLVRDGRRVPIENSGWTHLG